MNQDKSSSPISQSSLHVKIGLRAKLILVFLLVTVIPLMLFTLFAYYQKNELGKQLRDIAVADSSDALNDSAVENIERMSTDTAFDVAEFLYGRDADILYLASLTPSAESYRRFGEGASGRLIDEGSWVLAEDGASWQRIDGIPREATGGTSSNPENNDMGGFRYREPDALSYRTVPLYDEITFIDLDGQERFKYVAPDSSKTRYPMSTELQNVSRRENTYVKAESYFEALQRLAPGEIYVSDVIGAYVGSNYIGMYTPDTIAQAAESRGYGIEYAPEAQAYAGAENPNGQRFEGIVRWATPVTNENGTIIGYVTFALNHDHIMEFVDHLTPMTERYTEIPSAYEGNYAFIWDYQCRSICHPRHHSIVGYDPETGEPQIPWLESSIYEGFLESGPAHWTDYIEAAQIPAFDNQSRSKVPAGALTQAGLVGLDGRYLNNAPQCIGWMDLTGDGGSGSFYILWSGIYKLTTAAAIPYYTGQYAPSEENGFSRRGFGFVAIGAGLEDFTRPATETQTKLELATSENMHLTSIQLAIAATGMIALAVLTAILVASSATKSIRALVDGISLFRRGQRHFRFRAPVKDEFGALADAFDDMADGIVDNVKNSLAIIDTKCRVIYMNALCLEFCGAAQLRDVVGKDYGSISLYPPNSRYDPILALHESRAPDIYFDENRNRYFKATANIFTGQKGEKLGYIVETSDLTAMVLEQKAIEEQRSLLDKIFTASPDLIWYVDTDGRFVTVNPRFASISNLRPEDFTGKLPEEVLPPKLAENTTMSLRRVRRRGIPLYTEESILFADGHQESLDLVRTPIFDADGELVGMLGFARDVTQRVLMERQLRETKLDLEEAVKAANRANEHKGEFLARMSHEIRTPMNAIIGLSSIVQKRLETLGLADKKLLEISGQMTRIEASSQHLLGLLNDILDISKIDAGKLDLAMETVSLPQLAATVSNMIRPRCEEKNIEFITHFDPLDPDSFLTDPLRLRQVLINLLGNAVKFTPECGKIEFTIRKLAQANGQTSLSFLVKDNGIGIPKEQQDAIFQAFEQGGAHISQTHGGTGLGLSISQRIVKMLGGKILLDSAPDKGSLFQFQLWLEERAEKSGAQIVTADPAEQFSGKRLLLVDDVEINRVIVLSMLENTGLHIDEAQDGRQALTMVQDATLPYDIILMDIQMPIMDGYQAARAIRALNRPETNAVPIIALTANAFNEDIKKALENGMNAHIAKPLEYETLIDILFKFLMP